MGKPLGELEQGLTKRRGQQCQPELPHYLPIRIGDGLVDQDRGRLGRQHTEQGRRQTGQ